MGINRPIYLTNAKKFEGVNNLELLGIEYLNFNVNLNDFEYIIFTSQNGVIALDKQNNNWKTKKSLAISDGTASKIVELGGELFFVGRSGHGNSFAEEIVDFLTGKKALYIRPKEVASKLGTILKSCEIEFTEIIAYETTCMPQNKYNFSDNSIFIFTSPKMFGCFFSNFAWKSSWTAVAIGKTTADAIPNDISFIICDNPSIEDCVRLAKSL